MLLSASATTSWPGRAAMPVGSANADLEESCFIGGVCGGFGWLVGWLVDLVRLVDRTTANEQTNKHARTYIRVVGVGAVEHGAGAGAEGGGEVKAVGVGAPYLWWRRVRMCDMFMLESVVGWLLFRQRGRAFHSPVPDSSFRV